MAKYTEELAPKIQKISQEIREIRKDMFLCNLLKDCNAIETLKQKDSSVLLR